MAWRVSGVVSASTVAVAGPLVSNARPAFAESGPQARRTTCRARRCRLTAVLWSPTGSRHHAIEMHCHEPQRDEPDLPRDVRPCTTSSAAVAPTKRSVTWSRERPLATRRCRAEHTRPTMDRRGPTTRSRHCVPRSTESTATSRSTPRRSPFRCGSGDRRCRHRRRATPAIRRPWRPMTTTGRRPYRDQYFVRRRDRSWCCVMLRHVSATKRLHLVDGTQ